MKLKFDDALSNVALNFSLRRYNEAAGDVLLVEVYNHGWDKCVARASVALCALPLTGRTAVLHDFKLEV